MTSLLALFLCSGALSLLLTPMCGRVARRLGFLDRPDGRRKAHSDPVPRVGGVAILAASLFPAALLVLSPSGFGGLVGQSWTLVMGLLAAVLVVFATGLIDDLAGLKAWEKLAGQLVAASLACWAGIRIVGIGGHELPSWAAAPLTVCWLIICTNAINLIDGMDGLAAGISLFASLTMLVAGLVQDSLPLALATAPVAGALCGFLRYNFNPASIFLGDCGSLSLGFLLGVYGVIWSQKSTTALAMTAPLMALAIPLLDTAIAILRRGLRGQPIFGADRRHIHHMLLDRGMTPRRVVLLLYGICGVAATLSLLMSVLRGQYAGLVLVLFSVAAWTGIQHLGYIEFDLTGHLTHLYDFRQMLGAQIRLRTLEQALADAGSVDECWAALRTASQELGFTYVAMCLDHTAYEEDLWRNPVRSRWTVRFDISETDFVELGHSFGDSVPLKVVAPLAEILHRTLEPKLPDFQVENLPGRLIRERIATVPR